MRVLHVSGAKGWGGNEQQMVDLIPELSKLGVGNFVFGIENSLLHNECLNRKISFISSKNDKLNTLLNYRYLKTIVKEIKPDLIHLHTSDSLTVFTISDLLFGLKTKTVFSKKGMGTSSSFLSKLKYNYKGIDSIICVSNSVQRDLGIMLNNISKSKTMVIHDCVSLDILNVKANINLRETFDIPYNFKIIGNIANHTNAKDLPTFLNVVDYVINELKNTDIKFVQIGEFTESTSELKQIVKNKKLDQYIFFTDKIKSASSVLNQFDLFLLTSQREGGPTSVLEAMLQGIPVISTEVGLIPEVIQNGENGFFTPIKSVALLAEKIVLLLSNEKLQKQFSAFNIEKVKEQFLAPYIARETFTEYLRILKL